METKNKHLTENNMLQCYVILLLNFTSRCAFWCAECCNGILAKL